jgi:tRNA pseudouridine55 synthase
VARRPDADVHGLLVIDKPAGWTSHDVVARVRRLTGVRRVGHAGTLDPLATGVLVLGIGKGTRVLEYATEAEKRYTATVRLGASTDTYDADGAITATAPWEHLTAGQIRAALSGFLGEIEQRPPAYSAIKVDGVPLHRMARAGKAIEAAPRSVTILAIDLLDVRLPNVVIDVRCSKGTYIRSLAHDLGQRLGCGAHVTALRRTASGGISIEQALTLDEWAEALTDGSWPARLLPLDAPLTRLPALVLTAEIAGRLLDGVAPPPGGLELPAGTLARAYSNGGALLAVIRASDEDARWRVEKVLLSRGELESYGEIATELP